MCGAGTAPAAPAAPSINAASAVATLNIIDLRAKLQSLMQPRMQTRRRRTRRRTRRQGGGGGHTEPEKPRSLSLSRPRHLSQVYSKVPYATLWYQCLTPSPLRTSTLFTHTGIPSLGVNQIGSTNFSRVLAYCVLRTVTFTQTPVQVWRKITFAAPAQNSSVGCALFFRVTRSVLISDRCAISRRIVCAVFAHWGQT